MSEIHNHEQGAEGLRYIETSLFEDAATIVQRIPMTGPEIPLDLSKTYIIVGLSIAIGGVVRKISDIYPLSTTAESHVYEIRTEDDVSYELTAQLKKTGEASVTAAKPELQIDPNIYRTDTARMRQVSPISRATSWKRIEAGLDQTFKVGSYIGYGEDESMSMVVAIKPCMGSDEDHDAFELKTADGSVYVFEAEPRYEKIPLISRNDYASGFKIIKINTSESKTFDGFLLADIVRGRKLHFRKLDGTEVAQNTVDWIRKYADGVIILKLATGSRYELLHANHPIEGATLGIDVDLRKLLGTREDGTEHAVHPNIPY